MERPWNFKLETKMGVLSLPLTGYGILGVFPFFLGRDKFLVYLPFETLSLTNLSAYPHLLLITVTSSQCSPTMTTAESKPSASFHVYPHSQQHDIIFVI